MTYLLPLLDKLIAVTDKRPIEMNCAESDLRRLLRREEQPACS